MIQPHRGSCIDMGQVSVGGTFPAPAPVRPSIFIAVVRESPVGSHTPLTIPDHKKLKSSAPPTICSPAGIPRNEFLDTHEMTG
jgi:hypothetical protein